MQSLFNKQRPLHNTLPFETGVNCGFDFSWCSLQSRREGMNQRIFVPRLFVLFFTQEAGGVEEAQAVLNRIQVLSKCLAVYSN